jgi:hypothetical protein
MYAIKLLTGLALVLVVVSVVGAAGSLAASLGDAATVVTAAVLVAAILGIVGAGVAGAGGTDAGKTRYW